MKCTHDRRGPSVSMQTLVERGAIFTPIAPGLFSCEFPARNGVGPIGSSWEIEPSDDAYAAQYVAAGKSS
jgi:hypothetical protein